MRGSSERNLADILDEAATPVLARTGPSDAVIRGITHDSREVAPGHLFVAVPGERFDGHAFIARAVEAGAAAVLAQRVEALEQLPSGVAGVAVADTRAAMAEFAAITCGRPTAELDLLGVTGTNGKSSTCYFLDSIARAAGRRSGLFTTLEIRLPDGESRVASRTTPEATTLQTWLRRMADAGADQVAMEVSSHALDLGRVGCTAFAGVLFTNLTQDHLDWHHTMENYFQSKARLFTREVHLREDCVGAVNVGDPYGARLAETAECRLVRFALSGSADVVGRDVHLEPSATRFTLSAPDGDAEVRLKLLGRFAAWNAVAAAALSWGRGDALETIVQGLESLEAVPGRLERVGREGGPTVCVDYAHTPDSLYSVLSSVRELCAGRLICVFGCGGDRDPGKRPKMGRAVAEGADVPIVTSDNPRSENPDDVIDMIVPGLEGVEYTRISDRRKAIHHAVELARPEDFVVIAGKGHETYQEFKDETIHFDDREVAREALEARSR